MALTLTQWANALGDAIGLAAGDPKRAALISATLAWAPETPTDVASLVQGFVTDAGARDATYNAWWTGTANGGPNNDGYYPIQLFGGGTVSLPCPAKILSGTVLQVRGAVATTVALNALVAPANGDAYFVTGTLHFYGRLAGAWVDLGAYQPALGPLPANTISYDDTVSGIPPVTVQDAIDYLAGQLAAGGGGGGGTGSGSALDFTKPANSGLAAVL